MQILTSLQLQFEIFCDEVETNPNLFPEIGEFKNLSDNLKSIEAYLNAMVGEYEDCYKLFPNQSFIDDVPTILIENLPKLAEFIGKYSDAKDFRGKFKEPAKKVTGGLQKLLTSEND